MVEERAAGQQRHRLLAGVDQVGVFLARRRRRAHAEEAVLAVQEDLAVLRQMVGDQRRQADAEVDVRAFGDVARDARGHLVAAERFIAGPHAAACGCGPRVATLDRDDALHEDARRDDGFGIELAERHDLVHLRDRAFRRRRHDRAEVARGLAVDEVAPAVAALGLDQREVGVDRVLEHVAAAVDRARLLALGERRAVAGRREERADAGAGGADALGEVALRHQLELDLAGAVERVEHVRVGLARERADDLAHAPRLEQRGQARRRRCRRCC